MIRLATPLAVFGFAAALFAVPATAAERNYSVGSFERIRVDGPFRVVLTTGTSPGAKAEGDPRITDNLEVRVEGTTLIVRAGVNGWGEQPVANAAGAPIIRVSTGMIRAAALIGGGDLTIIGALRGQRIELQLAGSGSVRTDGVDADQFSATVFGTGSMTLGGRAARVSLSTNGPAQMQAGNLVASDLTISTSGNGEMIAQARFTATIASDGVGSVTVLGAPACVVRGKPAGPISCGKVPPSTP